LSVDERYQIKELFSMNHISMPNTNSWYEVPKFSSSEGINAFNLLVNEKMIIQNKDEMKWKNQFYKDYVLNELAK